MLLCPGNVPTSYVYASPRPDDIADCDDPCQGRHNVAHLGLDLIATGGAPCERQLRLENQEREVGVGHPYASSAGSSG